MSTEFIIGIVVFLLFSIFIIVIIIGWELSSRTNNNQPPVSTQSGTLLSSCTNSSCSNGLICDGSSFVCKFPAGVPCATYKDACVIGLICSGLCATGPTGGLNNLCPCNSGYLCTAQPNLLTICKGIGGTTCTINSDCVSGLCQSNHTCASGAPNSYPCTTNTQCASGNCNNGFCQNPGFTTGAVGSACYNSDCITFPSGITGSSCNSTQTEPLSCQCISGAGQPGTCVMANSGIISNCSSLAACSTDLICLNSSGTSCSGTGCICVFPYNDPNDLGPGNTCIKGMVISNSSCYNDVGLGCDIGGICANQSCGGSSVLAVYKFGSTTADNLGTNYVGATSTSINPATPGPNGIISPYKMFSVSNGMIDTIYLVDHMQGLLSLQYNPYTTTVLQPWTQLIPYITTVGNNTKTLIDVGYNGTTFIVAFNETISSMQNNTVYSGPNTSNLTPFNVQSGPGIPGTQYTVNNAPLNIQYIDISPANDVSSGGDVLIFINGTIYIKQNTQTKYNVGTIVGGPSNGKQMVGLVGPSRFYYDVIENKGATGPIGCPSSGGPIQCSSYQNVSFIGPFQSFGTTGIENQVLQFSGNIAGIAMPIDRFQSVQYEVFDYSIYSPGVTGMPNAQIIMLTNAYDNNIFIDNIVAVNSNGATTLLPYRITDTCRSVATANAFYIISVGSCK